MNPTSVSSCRMAGKSICWVHQHLLCWVHQHLLDCVTSHSPIHIWDTREFCKLFEVLIKMALSLTVLLPVFQDTNLKGHFGRAFMIQRSCVPLSLVYRPVFIPGCPKDVGSQFYYPSARCCSCRRCDTRMHHCVQPRPYSYDQCSLKLGGDEKEKSKPSGNLTTC